ncbi:hypothetical protein ACFVYG_33175 [Streptomyces sp. NPDC058256]|uniref:hypothetical protein n=1 Tax=Streptomyces sp. NPDC058256 TaxID=3346408 RepID=UPI0036E0EF9C
MESAESPLPEDVGLSDGDWRVESEEEEEEEESDPDDDVESEDELDELDELVELDEESVVPLAVVFASACIVPIRANIPAAAASVTAAAAAAVRRVPLRTAAAAPRSLPVMAAPLRMTLCHVLRSGSSLREVCEESIRPGRSL